MICALDRWISGAWTRKGCAPAGPEVPYSMVPVLVFDANANLPCVMIERGPYDPATDQYTYVWKTTKSWAGTCRRLTVTFNDGTQRYADFKFR